MEANQHRIITKSTWRRLRIGFKILLIMVLLAIVIKFLSDLHHSHILLLDKISDQQNQIIHMKNDLDLLQHQNLQLVNDLHNTQAQLHNIQQHAPKLTINHKPFDMTVQQVKDEVRSAGVNLPETSILVGGLEVARQIFTRLIMNGLLAH